MGILHEPKGLAGRMSSLILQTDRCAGRDVVTDGEAGLTEIDDGEGVIALDTIGLGGTGVVAPWLRWRNSDWLFFSVCFRELASPGIRVPPAASPNANDRVATGG